MIPKTGIVKSDTFLDHKPGHMHPEHPKRLKAVYKMLENFPSDNLVDIKPEPATLEQLELVHSQAYIQKVLKTAEHNFTSLAPDTPVCSKSYMSAWLAAGGCLTGIDALFKGLCDACFSLVRPPGHHAFKDRAGGFCIFNNIAIAARYAQKKYGLRRIIIVDWDIHHGNGINDLFYEEKEVFYFSTHDMLLYPYTGDFKETGLGPGKGYTVNIPITRDLDDNDMVGIYKSILLPVMENFAPELILVGAGFDAHRNDPIGRSMFTEHVFGRLTELLLICRSKTGNPPIMMVLEGGYDSKALADSVREVLETLTNDASYELVDTPVSINAEKIIEKTLHTHKKYGVFC